MKVLHRDERGAANVFLITTIIFGLLAIGLGVGFGWAYLNMSDAKTDLDGKIATAVEAAKTEQKETDAAECVEENKTPFSTFSGSSDFGSVGFEYPRTWSSYIDENGADGDLKYYFNPGSVPKVNDQTIYALRLSVENTRYEEVLQTFENLIQAGDLNATPITVNGHQGMRVSGKFSEAIGNGTAAIFAIRDKTLTLRTDSADFLADFDKLLATLQYKE